MKYLITGSAGFIGFHVSKALLEQGKKVVGIDNFNDYYDVNLKESRNAILEKYKDFTVYRIDLADKEALSEVFEKEKITKVCHLAAQAGVRYSLENPHIYIQSNIMSFVNLLEELKKHKINHLVYASSSSVYGSNTKVPFSEKDVVDHPISLYASTKRATELIAYTYNHLFNIKSIGLRFFTVYGSYGRPDMALFKFTKAILANKPIDIYNYGDMQRDFTYITDIVAGILSSLDKEYDYEIINLGNNNPENLLHFVEVIEKELNKKAKRNLMGIQPGDVAKTYANIEKAKNMLGFEPSVHIEEGIREFIKWYKSYYKPQLK